MAEDARATWQRDETAAELEGRARRAVRAWTAALVLLCAAVLWLQFRHIESTLPYPWDTDEGFVSGPASRTLLTGTLHPYIFTYPSLPKYLASIGMAVGFIRGATHLEVREIHQLGNVGYPYYETPRAMQGARQLFALLSVVALAATGIAAWHAFGKPSTILLAPLILSTSPLFFYHSWTYLNVDVVGLCFASLTLAACLQGTRQPSIRQSAIIPAVFAGLATGSKYTLVVVIAPVLLAIGLYLKPGRRMWACLAAMAVMVVAFLVVVPYSLLDIPGFLSGVAEEAFHYARGHTGWEADPGLPQLVFYGKHFASELGPVGVVAAVLGMGAYGAADWRRTIVLLVFPLALVWMLASQRVHFERNVLSLHPIVAMYVAYGIVVAHGWILKWAARREWSASRMKRLRLVAGLVLVATAVPLWHVRGMVRDRTDSRKLAQDWIETRLPSEWTVVVPAQMRFDARALKTHGTRVVEVDLQAARDPDAFQRVLSSVQGPAVVMVPHWGADARFPGQETADVLNKLSHGLQVIKTFGTNPVLVNYTEPAPWGDPAFDIALLGRQQIQLR